MEQNKKPLDQIFFKNSMNFEGDKFILELGKLKTRKFLLGFA